MSSSDARTGPAARKGVFLVLGIVILLVLPWSMFRNADTASWSGRQWTGAVSVSLLLVVIVVGMARILFPSVKRPGVIVTSLGVVGATLCVVLLWLPSEYLEFTLYVGLPIGLSCIFVRVFWAWRHRPLERG